MLSADPLEIPQTLGDIVSQSIRIVKGNARLMVSSLLFPSVLMCVGMSICRMIFGHWLKLQSLDVTVGIQHGAGILVAFFVLSYAQWELMVRGLAIMRFCTGTATDYKAACIYANRRWFSLFVIYSVATGLPLGVLSFWLIVSAVLMLFSHEFQFFPYLTILPFAAIGLCSVVSLAWSFLVGSMLLSVLACEDISILQTLKRAEDLTLRYLWRGGSFICLLSLVLYVLFVSLNVPLLAVMMFDIGCRGVFFEQIHLTSDVPAYLEVLAAVWAGVLNLVLLAVALVADALYYRDVCLRLEGLDIKMRLSEIHQVGLRQSK